MNTLSSLFVLATVLGIGAWFAHDRIRAYVDRAPIDLDHLDGVNLGTCDATGCGYRATTERLAINSIGVWPRRICTGHDNEGIAKKWWDAA